MNGLNQRPPHWSHPTSSTTYGLISTICKNDDNLLEEIKKTQRKKKITFFKGISVKRYSGHSGRLDGYSGRFSGRSETLNSSLFRLQFDDQWGFEPGIEMSEGTSFIHICNTTTDSADFIKTSIEIFFSVFSTKSGKCSLNSFQLSQCFSDGWWVCLKKEFFKIRVRTFFITFLSFWTASSTSFACSMSYNCFWVPTTSFIFSSYFFWISAVAWASSSSNFFLSTSGIAASLEFASRRNFSRRSFFFFETIDWTRFSSFNWN